MIKGEGDFHHESRFDEFLRLGEPETEAVVDLLTPVLDAKRGRARKSTEVEAFNRTVSLVAANALVSDERGVHYSRRLETYSGASPYKPPWLGSKRLLRMVDRLASEGLLETSDGRWAGVFADGKGSESSFAAAPPFVAELEALGIDLTTVERDREAAPVLKLKGSDKRLIRYGDLDESIAQKARELRDYNAFIEGQNISLPGAEIPKFSALARTYNDGKWTLGGRHFGGWWQGKSGAKRSEILINGEATEELDFGGFNPRVLYRLVGQEFRGEDPYEIPQIKLLLADLGIDWDTRGRKSTKRMLNIAISARSKAAFSSQDTIEEIDLPEDVIKLRVPMVIDYHSPIRDHLLKGRSLELMNHESNICQGIISNAKNDGVIVLQVFDSFIAPKSEVDYLRGQMISEYKREIGCDRSIH